MLNGAGGSPLLGELPFHLFHVKRGDLIEAQGGEARGKMVLIAAGIIDTLIGLVLLGPFEVLLCDFREQGGFIFS